MLEREALQVLDQNRLFDRLGVAHRDIGAAMSADECLSFNTTVDLAALRTYCTEVELRTQTVVEALWSEELSELVPETRFRQVMQAGAIGERDGVWLERFLMNRSKAWRLSSVIWHQTTHLLGEATWLRHQAGAPYKHADYLHVITRCKLARVIFSAVKRCKQAEDQERMTDSMSMYQVTNRVCPSCGIHWPLTSPSVAIVEDLTMLRLLHNHL